ncbi:MAG: hypothetical protein JOZ54_25960 [Acidobacteria bacterium]|nr:hypothetical protein [Acidobacteriota bacterium]
MLAPVLLAAALVLPPNSAILLKSGHRLEVVGGVREEKGQLLFRVEGGSLYSIPMSEVDVEATIAAAQPPAVVVAATEASRIKVSDEKKKQLLKELEANHNGKPLPPPPATPPPAPAAAPAPPPEPAQSLRNPEEWAWRTRARAVDEAVRQAEENLALLTKRAEQLKSQISGFLSLGFNPRQFSYQTTQLQYVQEQIPVAELEVQRAKRAQTQFREDARKQNILPGWLRD